MEAHNSTTTSGTTTWSARLPATKYTGDIKVNANTSATYEATKLKTINDATSGTVTHTFTMVLLKEQQVI